MKISAAHKLKEVSTRPPTHHVGESHQVAWSDKGDIKRGLVRRLIPAGEGPASIGRLGGGEGGEGGYTR